MRSTNRILKEIAVLECENGKIFQARSLRARSHNLDFLNVSVLSNTVVYSSGGSRICEKGGGGGAGNPNSSMPCPKIGQNRPKKQKSAEKRGAAADSAPPWIRHWFIAPYYYEKIKAYNYVSEALARFARSCI